MQKLVEMPRWVEILRALVRPIVTLVLVGVAAWNTAAGNPVDVEFYVLTSVCAAFWFGGKSARDGFLGYFAGKNGGGK